MFPCHACPRGLQPRPLPFVRRQAQTQPGFLNNQDPTLQFYFCNCHQIFAPGNFLIVISKMYHFLVHLLLSFKTGMPSTHSSLLILQFQSAITVSTKLSPLTHPYEIVQDNFIFFHQTM